MQRVTGTVDWQVEAWNVIMVKPGYHGPFLARASVLCGRDRVAVECTITDEVAGGRVIASASATYRRVAS